MNASGAVVERYKYLAFGQEQILTATGAPLAASACGNPYRFQGRWRDYEEGGPLYYFRARYYRPDTGRFVTRDPTGSWRGQTGGNGYLAFGNDAIDHADPTGLEWVTLPSGGRMWNGAGSDIPPRTNADGTPWVKFSDDPGTASSTSSTSQASPAQNERILQLMDQLSKGSNNPFPPKPPAPDPADPSIRPCPSRASRYGVADFIIDVLTLPARFVAGIPMDLAERFMDRDPSTTIQTQLSAQGWTPEMIAAQLRLTTSQFQSDQQLANDWGYTLSPLQQRYAMYTSQMLGNGVNWAQAAAANPSGGRMGPGMWFVQVPGTNIGIPTIPVPTNAPGGAHSVIHDSLGYIYTTFEVGYGYGFGALPGSPFNPLLGQVGGLIWDLLTAIPRALGLYDPTPLPPPPTVSDDPSQ